MAALDFGFSVGDLYGRDGLVRLDGVFCDWLGARDGDLAARLTAARANPDAVSKKDESELLIALGPECEAFIARLFGVEAEVASLQARHNALAPLFDVKRNFVQRQALKKIKPDAAAGAELDGEALTRAMTALLGADFDELAFAVQVQAWERDREQHQAELELAMRYAAWATRTQAGRARHPGALFREPQKIDPQHLIHGLASDSEAGFTQHRLAAFSLRRREGFALTDQGADLKGALDQANYCIFCHHQAKDSCSTGLREKPAKAAAAPSVTLEPFKKSPFDVALTGCPLEEKISEMHVLKVAGHTLGALAMIVVDNPMAAATGHRICNDCMKSCIYQKQDPVDIPQAETRTLKDVLELPWGFEIYSLLTRWNPLNLRRPAPLAPSGRRVLVVGLGPAGFTLAHHLMNDGHTVVGIDGLKIEPLPAEVSGVTALGERVAFQPVRQVEALYESLDDRVMAGFGGVAEYGITVRWNKNFLKLIRLLLERRTEFAMVGGVRFGGTITLDQAFALGFDHVAIAVGAGKPTVIDVPNGLARGVRAASDFLMALQLTGAAKTDSVANLQLRLPVVVVGGGLTAVDAATEALAYYPVQVEKFLHRFETLSAERGEAKVRGKWRNDEMAIADEFIAHGRAIRAERSRAASAGEPPRILELLQSWGGATIAYRRRLIDSPSYTLNHEEVAKALEEGISVAEALNPAAVEIDAFGHASALKCARMTRGEDGKWASAGEVSLPARAILVAAGTQPNTVLAREDPGHFQIDGKYFRAYDEHGEAVAPERSVKPGKVHVLLRKHQDGRYASFFGDVHPSFFGNVVKAMGSAKLGYPVVSRLLNARAPEQPGDTGQSDPGAFLANFNRDFRARVKAVNRLTPTIVEVVVDAPAAARAFRPGQFYRLQNFEVNATRTGGTTLAMEGLAMTGAWVDKGKGLLALIVLEMGGSSDLCTLLQPSEPVVVMGPTGTASHIGANETVVLAGGGLGNAVLFSIGKAMRAAGNKVLYFAGYRTRIDRYKVAEIEAAADVIVWACDEAPGFAATRPQDFSFTGNIVDAMQTYASGELGPVTLPLAAADHLLAIGSDRMMAAVTQARHGVLKPYLKPGHVAIGSINSPMQCMMKEICAQCLQTHIDPQSGERSYVFSCFNQDQPLDQMDWAGLSARLGQNSVQEKLTAQWIDRCLVELRVRKLVA
jgi:NADPH-dependent glutamate synthase beta subunit-like oxidoreductase/NAD(P)H-flavin reductase